MLHTYIHVDQECMSHRRFVWLMHSCIDQCVYTSSDVMGISVLLQEQLFFFFQSYWRILPHTGTRLSAFVKSYTYAWTLHLYIREHKTANIVRRNTWTHKSVYAAVKVYKVDWETDTNTLFTTSLPPDIGMRTCYSFCILHYYTHSDNRISAVKVYFATTTIFLGKQQSAYEVSHNTAYVYYTLPSQNLT